MVHLQGWGEPLLHPGLAGFIEAARAAGCFPTTTTNAVDLDGDRAVRLAEAGLEILGVSMAGVDPEFNDLLRRGTSARNIVAAVEAAANELARRRRDRPRLHVAYMLTRSGRAHFPEAVRVLARAGAQKIVASSLDLVPDESLAGELFLDTGVDEEAYLSEVLAEATSIAREMGVELVVQLATARVPGDCPERPDRSLFVGFDGEVFPCVYTGVPLSRPVEHWIPAGRTKLARTPIGSLDGGNLRKIWKSAAARHFRRDAASPRRRSGRCLTCLKPRVEVRTLSPLQTEPLLLPLQ